MTGDGHADQENDRLSAAYAKLLEEHAKYDQLAAARVTWFVKSAAVRKTETHRQANGSDWLTDWCGMLAETADIADELDEWTDNLSEKVSVRFRKAAAKVAKAHAQLTKLETDEDVRRLLAYRAVVSDHLPQIIEVDLQP